MGRIERMQKDPPHLPHLLNPHSILLQPKMGALPQSAVYKYDTLTNAHAP